MIVDNSGAYDLSYYLIGIGICTSGVVISFILCYDKIKKRSNEKLEKSGLISNTDDVKITGSKNTLKKLVEEE